MPRSSKVYKKRKPICVGNRKVVVVREENNDESAGSDRDSVDLSASPRPTPPQSDVPQQNSSSMKKIGENLAYYQNYLGNCEICDLVNLRTVQNLLGKIAVCLHCGAKLYLVAKDRLALGFTVEIMCVNCNFSVKESNSPALSTGKGGINVRLAYAFRCVGVGEQGA
ncbi:hypothetical protein J6590_098819 [Homalodisca vitripennis]|nr:hypothetical protein J6590_098819 [Homalodisca vitripennis]